jgi:hypothetical protein
MHESALAIPYAFKVLWVRLSNPSDDALIVTERR